MSSLRGSVERQWYSRPDWLLLLAPLVPLFIALSSVRRVLHSRSTKALSVPVVVVGNITVGGTGKSPTIIALAIALKAAGYSPGVVTRGYGSLSSGCRVVPAGGLASEFGDEPVMIAEASSCPVVVGANRTEAANLLVEQYHCDVILSDDGLQHYRLHRDVELAVIDGGRLLGNGWRLPVGPLRESAARLRETDFVLINGNQIPPEAPPDRSFCFSLQPIAWRNVRTGRRLPLPELPLDGAAALAGIGNPERFFNTLQSIGFRGERHSFADHHLFSEADLRPWTNRRLLMTEKDAVKCRAFAADNWWALSVEADLPQDFLSRLLTLL